MSSAGARRPSPAVYRRRRILALLLLLAVLGGITWGVLALLSGDEDEPAGAAAAGADVQLASESGAAADEPPPEPGAVVACASGDLGLDVETDPAEPAAGTSVTFQLVVRNEGQLPCLLDAGPGDLVVTVSSGSDSVWSSAHCAEGSNELLLDVGAHYTVPVRWGGQRSVEGCEGGQPAVGAGTYRAAFSLGGTPLSLPEPVVLPLG